HTPTSAFGSVPHAASATNKKLPSQLAPPGRLSDRGTGSRLARRCALSILAIKKSWLLAWAVDLLSWPWSGPGVGAVAGSAGGPAEHGHGAAPWVAAVATATAGAGLRRGDCGGALAGFSRRRGAQSVRSVAMLADSGGPSTMRALTKIRLREKPDVGSAPTGDALEAGETFQALEVLQSEATGGMCYLRVNGKCGWAFATGVSGSWAGKPICELVPEDQVQKSVEDLNRERAEEAARKAAEEEKRRDEAEERAAAQAEQDRAPVEPTEMSVLRLLSFARGRTDVVKVHPGLSVKGAQLIVSLPISADTPLIGVMPGFVLSDELPAEGPGGAEGADTAEEFQGLMKSAAGSPVDSPELRLGLQLMREKALGMGSWWEPYVASLPPRAAPPLAWGDRELAELQYAPARQAVSEEVERLRSFADACLKPESLGGLPGDALTELRWAVAAARQRAVPLGGGRSGLVPLVDLVGPPGAGDEGPSCRLVPEGPVQVLYAARSLRPGDVLTRDLGLDGEEYLWQRGLPPPQLAADEPLQVWGLVAEGAALWQLKAITAAVPTRPGRLAGDVLVRGEVRRGEHVEEMISESLFHAARALSCRTEEELDVYVGEPQDVPVVAGDSRGLAGLFGDRRAACVDRLVDLLRGANEFPTTLQEDEKQLPDLQGWKRAAVTFRMEKKRVLQEVVQKLAEAREDPEGGGGGALPFAVTGTA
ncbi:unnamed protein product, partial [Prorocentrum cordatum]